MDESRCSTPIPHEGPGAEGPAVLAAEAADHARRGPPNTPGDGRQAIEAKGIGSGRTVARSLQTRIADRRLKRARQRLEIELVGSVASEVSAVHHARAGHGLHGSAQASNQPGAGAFGVLLDGTDDTPAPAAHSVPPGPQSSPPPPAQPNSPDHPASQTRAATQADPAQAPPQPGNPPPANTVAHTRDDAQADAGTRPDDGKASTSAPGP